MNTVQIDINAETLANDEASASLEDLRGPKSFRDFWGEKSDSHTGWNTGAR